MRLFVALDIPDAVREALGGLIGKLERVARGARWVRPAGVHVTLKFIGETPVEKVDSIRGGLATIRMAAPVEMAFRDVGFFPNERRPRVFWVGIFATPNLAELAAQVERQLEPLGIPREERAFRPHLTLARFPAPSSQDRLREALGRVGRLEFGGTRAHEFHLYQSHLKPGGAEYARLATFTFVGGASA